MSEPLNYENLCGWHDEPAKVIADLKQMPRAIFSDAAAGIMGSTPKTTLLYKAWKDVTGSYPQYPAQQIGDCTSFGSGHAIDLLEAVQIAIGGKAEAYKETCTEAIYGAARAIAGMLRGGDGCYGSAVARAVTELGTISREAVGPYSGNRSKEWGRTGVPSDVKDKLAEHKVATASLIRTVDEAKISISNGYPFLICSSVGFTLRRDKNGFCHPSGRWDHCMCVIGIREDATPGACVGQSWGEGPDSPGPHGPTDLDQPEFSFWVTWDALERILAAGDSYAFSSFNGYPGQPLPGHWSYADVASA